MDRYHRTTQLGPAIAALAPLIIAALATFRLDDLPRSLLTVAVAAGFPLVIMRLVRDRGNKVQVRLWEQWGGQPTAARLRWRSAQDHETHAALHSRVQRATGVKLPKPAAERADPPKADVTYEQAVAQLRELTRDHNRFHLVFTELLEYSTARNLLGVKPVGLGVSGFVLLLAVIAAVLTARGAADFDRLGIAISGVVSSVTAILWLAIITPAYVKKPAQRYASALLGAVTELGDSRAR